MKKVDAPIEDKKVYWVVLKMAKTVSYTDSITRQEVKVELSGCAGYIPVFSTEQEAKENSCEGKFDIVAITA